jgi:hypothetical protein
MKAKTYVKGDKELQALLKRLKAAGAGKKLVPAVNAGLSLIQNEIVANAPYKTGTYKRSWHLGEPTTTSTSAHNTTGTDVVYAARLEFGYEGTDSLGRSYHQSAQPHVRPAFDAKRDAAIQEVTDALRDIIEAGL